jgi:hypothetical protein
MNPGQLHSPAMARILRYVGGPKTWPLQNLLVGTAAVTTTSAHLGAVGFQLR